MRKDISFFVILAALILTAGIGGWTVLTTSHVKAAATATDGFRGSTTLGGGLFFVPPPVY
jgi:hypothetical protein